MSSGGWALVLAGNRHGDELVGKTGERRQELAGVLTDHHGDDQSQGARHAFLQITHRSSQNRAGGALWPPSSHSSLSPPTTS